MASFKEDRANNSKGWEERVWAGARGTSHSVSTGANKKNGDMKKSRSQAQSVKQV